MANQRPTIITDFADFKKRVAERGGEILADQLHLTLRFPNNLGASVIRQLAHFGRPTEFYEIGILRFTRGSGYSGEFYGGTSFSTREGDPILGWLPGPEAMEILKGIFELPREIG